MIFKNKKKTTLALVLLMWSLISFSQKIEISPRTVSLQIGTTFQLEIKNGILGTTWYSNNPNIIISKEGLLSTPDKTVSTNKIAKVFLVNSNRKKLDSITVSLVNWTSNKSKLIDKMIYTKTGSTIYLGHKNDSILSYNFSSPNKIFLSIKDFDNFKILSPFHKLRIPTFSNFISNKFGYIIKDSCDISFSKNLKDWNLIYKTRTSSFRNSICQYFDSSSQKSYIFTADYHTIDSLQSSVYRGVMSSSGIKFDPIYTFYSRRDYKKNNLLYPQARHIHAITVDPFTNNIWMATGDEDQESFLMYSSDNGENWNIIGTGSQDWRIISIWFTDKYIYWSVDTWKNQKIFRVSRSIYSENGKWPCITPIISNKYTKVGIKYFVLKCDTNSELPSKVGSFFVEEKKRIISDKTELIAINDPSYDYREIIESIENSALWFNINVYDNKGDQITLLSSDAEGKILDDKSRVFGIKERADGTVDVQEVYSIKATNNYSQLIPCLQNSEGLIYYWGYYTDWFMHKMELAWVDNSQTIGGQVVENTDLKHNKQEIKLKLLDYDGDILYWEKGSAHFQWEKINITKDTITIKPEEKISYYRAIVKKGHFPSVSSLPYKVYSFCIQDSVNPNSEKKNIEIFPNPIKDFIKLIGIDINDTKLYLEMYNASGQKTLQKTISVVSNNMFETIYLYGIPKGVYLINIWGNHTHYSKKIEII